MASTSFVEDSNIVAEPDCENPVDSLRVGSDVGATILANRPYIFNGELYCLSFLFQESSLVSFQPELSATFAKVTAAKRIPTNLFQVSIRLLELISLPLSFAF